MKKKISQKILYLLFLSGAAAAILSGCGKMVEVSIQDLYTQTLFSAPEGTTVREALEEAEIVIGEGDQVTPSLDTKLNEDDNQIAVTRHAKAKIAVDDTVMDVELTGGKVKDALTMADITLGEHDCIDHEPEAYVTDGMTVSIIRRLEVSVTADGSTKKFLTEADTVKELLSQEGITLGKRDKIKPKLSKNLKEGMKITVKRVDVRKDVKTETVAFQTQIKKSKDMFVGTSKVTRQGVDGEKKVTYRVTYVDGKEEERKAVKEKVTKKPVDKIITQGTKQKPSAGKSKGGTGKKIVSKKKVYDCDGSGHGYYIIKYSDGSIKHKNF